MKTLLIRIYTTPGYFERAEISREVFYINNFLNIDIKEIKRIVSLHLEILDIKKRTEEIKIYISSDNTEKGLSWGLQLYTFLILEYPEIILDCDIRILKTFVRKSINQISLDY